MDVLMRTGEITTHLLFRLHMGPGFTVKYLNTVHYLNCTRSPKTTFPFQMMIPTQGLGLSADIEYRSITRLISDLNLNNCRDRENVAIVICSVATPVVLLCIWGFLQTHIIDFI